MDGVDIINPWIIKDYIHTHKTTRRVFNLPVDQTLLDLPKHKHDDEGDDEYYDMTPVTLQVTVHGRYTVDITYEALLGVMAVYRHLHIMHPFTYNGHTFNQEMDEVNDKAFDKYHCRYRVTVGDNVYSFRDIAFFQGLITGATWNNLNPYTFITNLQQERVEDAHFNPLTLTQIAPKQWIDLNY